MRAKSVRTTLTSIPPKEGEEVIGSGFAQPDSYHLNRSTKRGQEYLSRQGAKKVFSYFRTWRLLRLAQDMLCVSA